MAKPTNPESRSLIDRFNRRREKVAAEARSDQTDEEHLVSKDLDDTDIADEEDALSDSELLKKYELPDPEMVEDEAALDQFFEGELPERLKRLALRRVWRLNPLFRFADEMVEYGEDYTDAATVVEGMQTAYEVGKGYLAKVKEALEGGVGDHYCEQNLVVYSSCAGPGCASPPIEGSPAKACLSRPRKLCEG